MPELYRCSAALDRSRPASSPAGDPCFAGVSWPNRCALPAPGQSPCYRRLRAESPALQITLRFAAITGANGVTIVSAGGKAADFERSFPSPPVRGGGGCCSSIQTSHWGIALPQLVTPASLSAQGPADMPTTLLCHARSLPCFPRPVHHPGHMPRHRGRARPPGSPGPALGALAAPQSTSMGLSSTPYPAATPPSSDSAVLVRTRCPAPALCSTTSPRRTSVE